MTTPPNPKLLPNHALILIACYPRLVIYLSFRSSTCFQSTSVVRR